MKCLIKDYFNSLYTNETNLYGSCRRGLYTMNRERLYHCELYGVDSIWNEIWDEEVYQVNGKINTAWVIYKEQV